MWRRIAGYTIAVILFLGAIYYLMAARTPVATQLPAPTPIVHKVAVVGTEFAFTPSTLSLQNGQPVELTFTNNGTFPHNLAVPDLNVQTKTIDPGQSDTIIFTPTKTGTFGFLCTVPGHADKGMKGSMTVQ